MSLARHFPDRAGFRAACVRSDDDQPISLVPIFREVVADADTPVSAFDRLVRAVGGQYGFLLESVIGGEKWAAYSFIGVSPRAVLRVAGGQATTTFFDVEGGGGSEERHSDAPDATEALGRFVAPFRTPSVTGLPRFFGGAVGYLGYDAVRGWEPIPSRLENDLGLPEAVFVLSDTLIIFDNFRQTVKVVATAHVPDPGDAARCEMAYDSACKRIDALVDALRSPGPPLAPLDLEAATRQDVVSRTSPERFVAAVRQAKEHILAGDAFQIVLSQRFEAARDGADPFDVYRALRVINPSPYMFHIQLPDAVITGASPETLVRLEGRRVEVRPIAGTRRRGVDASDDDRLESELLADEKERAEHVMLIDLGRNDVGRVSRIGSVRVEQVMAVERYSHVMHMVSLVSGELDEKYDAIDVIRAAFPAGTLSGAPKVRAMQIIEELEPVRRGIYGGAVGYLSFPNRQGESNLDLAIAIRTLVTRGDRVYVQAGAGIVYDSIPEAELEETRNKARAVVRALELAHGVVRAPSVKGQP